MRVLIHIGLVAFGSALGGVTRWGLGQLAMRLFGSSIPWGTLLINLMGCLFMGWLATLLGDRVLHRVGWLDADDLRLLLAVGFIGAFSTFPLFAYEVDVMLRKDGFLGTVYLLGSVLLGLTALRLGIFLARWS